MPLVSIRLTIYPCESEEVTRRCANNRVNVVFTIRTKQDVILNVFKDVTLTNLEVSTSDHCPLLLEWCKTQQIVRIHHFRFENAWLREPMCEQLVADV